MSRMPTAVPFLTFVPVYLRKFGSDPIMVHDLPFLTMDAAEVRKRIIGARCGLKKARALRLYNGDGMPLEETILHKFKKKDILEVDVLVNVKFHRDNTIAAHGISWNSKIEDVKKYYCNLAKIPPCGVTLWQDKDVMVHLEDHLHLFDFLDEEKLFAKDKGGMLNGAAFDIFVERKMRAELACVKQTSGEKVNPLMSTNAELTKVSPESRIV